MRKIKVLNQLFIFAIYIFIAGQATANNISVSNATITAQNTSAQTCNVEFDISWENSWRHVVNYDASWVFIKYSTDGGNTWAHATLKSSGTNPANFSRGTGTLLDIVVPADKKGAFLRRSANGAGTISTTDVQLVWDWGASGLSGGNTARVKVFAVEMVYMPQGAFYAGSGGTGTNEFTLTQITTPNAGVAGGYPTGQTAPNSSWSNGYTAFYVMKYEISQQQYVDFFNTLTNAQKTERDITGNHVTYSGKNSDAEVYRNTISWSSGNASAGANSNVACNYICWADLIAYADWAALRPMSELEFEKSCRGMANAIPNEYPWGNIVITQAEGPVQNSGAVNETASTIGDGLCNYNGTGTDIGAPLRCGFASTSDTTRRGAGAGYYAVMELGGNVWERPVTIADATGRAFTGANGDGALSANGDANTSNWPGTDAVGSGLRGGGCDSLATSVYASDRSLADSTAVHRYYYSGGRCVRTAP